MLISLLGSPFSSYSTGALMACLVTLVGLSFLRGRSESLSSSSLPANSL